LQNIFGVAAPGGGYLGASGGANFLTDLYQPGAIPTGVPETSTWAMMLVGFAGLAAAGYSRKARALVALG
jgi:hypothetical protein